jgi:hypothetical protein
VNTLRAALEQVQHSQVIYIEVDHWSDFPHVAWDLLQSEEQRNLDKHFHRCNGAAPYVKGQSSLPPAIPKVGAHWST